MTELKRYWFKFNDVAGPSALRLGCGVTANGYEDAVELIRAKVFGGGDIPPLAGVVENINVAELDPRHVIPNMESPVARGIWFPRGYT